MWVLSPTIIVSPDSVRSLVFWANSAASESLTSGRISVKSAFTTIGLIPVAAARKIEFLIASSLKICAGIPLMYSI